MGVAMDVPLIVFVEVSVSHESEVMLARARTSPRTDRSSRRSRVSVASVAPMVMASATSAGEEVHASRSLPAATA